MQYEGPIFGRIAGKYIKLETWIPANKPHKENKDVIACLKDGTFFMARYSNVSGWGFYFLDNGFQYDSTVSNAVTHWMPLSSLPQVPNQ